MTLVGDGTALTVKEAQERLTAAGFGVSDQTVRSYVQRGQLRAWWTGGGHHRIYRDSVDELIAVFTIQNKAERDAALDDLMRRNRAARGEAPE